MLIATKDFSLDDTLSAGQAFCWNNEYETWWSGWIDGHPCSLRQVGDQVEVRGDFTGAARVIHYLGLDEDPHTLLAPYLDEPRLREAFLATSGLRCVREPWWECTVNFICSSLKQIVHIRQLNRNLRERCGRPHPAGGHCFPTPEEIADAGEASLRSIGLGYRARFLHLAAEKIASGTFRPEDLEPLSTPDAALKLRELPGIGDKVAKCILLYGFRRFDAFPVDVWIARIMHEWYFPRRRKLPTPLQINRKSQRLFGDHRGLAQCHLFHYARTQAVFSRKSESR